MNILIAGGSKGSGVIRGQQLGAAIGASVEARPGRYWGAVDVAVLLKKSAVQVGAEAKKTGARLVWDVLDWWEQPDENALPIQEHIAKVHAVRDRVGLSLLVGATKQMAEDIGGVYLPHHSRPGLAPTPIRPDAKVVAYEGTPKYLGPWRKEIEYACARLGLVFLVNPPSLSDADILVAFRGEKWDGEVCQRWKSGVKYVNAIAAGRPILTNHSAGFNEIQPFGQVVESPDHLLAAMRAMVPAQTRQQCLDVSQARAGAFSLETVARQYRGMLATVAEQVAA